MLTAEIVTKTLNKEYPKAEIALTHKNPLQLLISVILSAQCTDKRVNMVTPVLFAKYKKAEDYAYGDLEDLKQMIRSTGFFNAKARNIQNACKIIVEEHNGKVPQTMDSLLKLPGVGRKTANIVLSNAFGKLEGIAVDTHVKRITYRLDLTKNTNPVKIEQDLMKILPKDKWNHYTYLIIEHGRAICKAPIPICSKCILEKDCPKVSVNKSK